MCRNIKYFSHSFISFFIIKIGLYGNTNVHYVCLKNLVFKSYFSFNFYTLISYTLNSFVIFTGHFLFESLHFPLLSFDGIEKEDLEVDGKEVVLEEERAPAGPTATPPRSPPTRTVSRPGDGSSKIELNLETASVETLLTTTVGGGWGLGPATQGKRDEAWACWRTWGGGPLGLGGPLGRGGRGGPRGLGNLIRCTPWLVCCELDWNVKRWKADQAAHTPT